MASYAAAKEMPHPSGSKVCFAYSTEDEVRLNEEFQAFRLEQIEAHAAALEGRAIRPIDPPRRGPGRPPKQEIV